MARKTNPLKKAKKSYMKAAKKFRSGGY